MFDPMLTKGVSSLQFLVVVVVVVFIKRSSQMAFFTVISTSSYSLFYCKVWHFQYFVLIVKECKPMFLGWFLQSMFFHCVLDLIVRGEWILRSSKLYCVGIWRCPFPSLFLVHSSIFDRQWTIKGRRWPFWTSMFPYFFRGHFLSSYPFCTSYFFPWYISDVCVGSRWRTEGGE